MPEGTVLGVVNDICVPSPSLSEQLFQGRAGRLASPEIQHARHPAGNL